jgi:hypothetical protein
MDCVTLRYLQQQTWRMAGFSPIVVKLLRHTIANQ